MRGLESERVVVSAPLSFAGSAQRLWRGSQRFSQQWARIVVGALAVLAIGCVWLLVAVWYVLVIGLFGLLVVPYRLLRRGSRSRKQQAIRHREMLRLLQRR